MNYENAKNSPRNAILSVIFAMAMAILSFDIYIPSMPAMTKFFDTTPMYMQFSLSALVLGACTCTIFMGPISDSMGRRKLIVFSMIAYTLACVMSASAKSIEIFILSRFLHGIATTAPSLLCFAVISDLFEPKKASIYYAYLTTVLTATLIIAPAFGGFFAYYYSWQTIFEFLVCCGVAAFVLLYYFLPETLQKRSPFSLAHSMIVYKEMMLNTDFIVLAILPSLMVGGIIAFMANINYHYINALGMDVGMFALYQSLIMGSNAASSFIAAGMIAKRGLEFTIKIAIALSTLGGALFFIASLSVLDNYNLLTAIICIYAAGLGLGFAAFTAKAMQLYPENSGAASALIATVRSLIIMVCVFISGLLYSGSIWEIGLFVLLNAVLVLILNFMFKPKIVV